MTRLSILFIGLFISIHSTSAEEGRLETIESINETEAIKIALRANPGYKGAVAKARAANGLTYQSGLWKNPSLFGRTEEYPPDESFENSRYFFGLSQTVPFPGKMKLNKAAANEYEQSLKAMSNNARIDLIRRVRIAFYKALVAKEFVEVSEKLLLLANSSVEIANERIEAGVSTTQELLRAEVQVERVKNTKLTFERNLKISQTELARTMGKSDISGVLIDGLLHDKIPEGLLEFDSEEVINQNPKVLAAEALLQRSKTLKKRAKIDPYPDVTLSIAAGRREVNDETLVDFGFSIPLPILDSSKGNIYAAGENQRKAASDLEQTIQSLKARLANEIETLKQSHRQVGNYRERIIPQSEEALEIVQEGFREGKYGLNDLLDTQRTLAEARIEYLQVLFSLNRSIAEIKSYTNLRELL